MTALTTCDALQYAVRPNSSTEFENLSKRFRFHETTTELQAARILFYGGIFTMVLGGLSMLTVDNPEKCTSFLTLGSCICGTGSMKLYYAAQRIRGLWQVKNRI